MTERDLVTALQGAILRADSTWINQPSHLRRRLEEELGPDARGHRAQIHQLVVAAEERIPIRLKRNGWSPSERDELGHLLVVTRGWTAEASEWAVTVWAAALGLTDERPVRPLPAAASRSERAPVVQAKRPQASADAAVPGATDVPSESFGTSTELPSELWAGATALPDEFVAATELPTRPPPPPPPPPMAKAPIAPPAMAPPPMAPAPPPMAPSVPPPPMASAVSSTKAKPKPPTASADLPKYGTRAVRRKTKKFLGHPVDAAYLVKAGPTPAFLLLAFPLAVAGLALPGRGAVLLVLYFLVMMFGTVLWPARILAIAGDDVWLLSKKFGFSTKPKALISKGTRDQIVFTGGKPFPSVQFAGERLWFQYPVTRAARRLPTAKVEATRA